MGEYAKLRAFPSESVKIGTCEDMYYLRANQVDEVIPESGSLNPREVRDVIRFRFPFPDEDNVSPGAFDNHDRGIGLYGVEAPEGVEHSSVQFVASAGYNVCLPCPESGENGHGLHVHRNGFPGPVRLVQQAWRGGKLVGIMACGGCGAKYNMPTLEDARPVLDALEDYAAKAEHSWAIHPQNDGSPDGTAIWYREVARRLEAGYSA